MSAHGSGTPAPAGAPAPSASRGGGKDLLFFSAFWAFFYVIALYITSIVLDAHAAGELEKLKWQKDIMPTLVYFGVTILFALGCYKTGVAWGYWSGGGTAAALPSIGKPLRFLCLLALLGIILYLVWGKSWKFPLVQVHTGGNADYLSAVRQAVRQEIAQKIAPYTVTAPMADGTNIVWSEKILRKGTSDTYIVIDPHEETAKPFIRKLTDGVETSLEEPRPGWQIQLRSTTNRPLEVTVREIDREEWERIKYRYKH